MQYSFNKSWPTHWLTLAGIESPFLVARGKMSRPGRLGWIQTKQCFLRSVDIFKLVVAVWSSSAFENEVNGCWEGWVWGWMFVSKQRTKEVIPIAFSVALNNPLNGNCLLDTNRILVRSDQSGLRSLLSSSLPLLAFCLSEKRQKNQLDVTTN